MTPFLQIGQTTISYEVRNSTKATCMHIYV